MDKIALITDQHFGVRNDSELFLSHFSKFYSEVFFPEIDKHNIKTIIDLGDTFDRRKYINFKTLNIAKEIWFDELKKRDIQLYIIIGNHSTYYKNTNDINSPHLLLSGYDNIHIIDKPTSVENMLLVPWITPENENDIYQNLAKSKCEYLFGHFEMQGFQVIKGIQSNEGINPVLFNRFKKVFSGHYHLRQHSNNIYYLGSPYQITFNDCGTKKGFHFFDNVTGDVEFKENPNDIFHTLIYDDVNNDYTQIEFPNYKDCYLKILVVKKENPYLFDKYLDAINQSSPYHINVIEDIDTSIGNEDIEFLSEDTLTLINAEIDLLNLEVDKNKLKTIVRTLYLECFE